jgi:hypothetical protein
MNTSILLTTPMPTTINKDILLHFYGSSGYTDVLHCFGKGSAYVFRWKVCRNWDCTIGIITEVQAEQLSGCG